MKHLAWLIAVVLNLKLLVDVAPKLPTSDKQSFLALARTNQPTELALGAHPIASCNRHDHSRHVLLKKTLLHLAWVGRWTRWSKWFIEL